MDNNVKILNTSKIFIENLSRRCEPSSYLLNKIIKFLTSNEYNFVSSIDKADVLLINTCCVVQNNVRFSKKVIDEALVKKNLVKIIFFGCATKVIKNYHDNSTIEYVGPKELEKFNILFPHKYLINECSTYNFVNNSFIPYQSKVTNKDNYIMISQGCIHSCSYCNIKKAKGVLIVNLLKVL